MSKLVSRDLVKLLGEWEGFELVEMTTEETGGDVFGAPAPRVVLVLQPKADIRNGAVSAARLSRRFTM